MILMPSVSTPLEVSSATVEKATREMASPAEVSMAKLLFLALLLIVVNC